MFSNALVASTAPKEHSGEALGLLQTGTWIGIAVGPLIGGVIGDTFGFRESFWVTEILLALSAFSIFIWVQEDFKPAISALINLHTPLGNQGATYGLYASITAAGRGLAPMLGAIFAIWFGMRSVLVLSAVIYGLTTLVVLLILRNDHS